MPGLAAREAHAGQCPVVTPVRRKGRGLQAALSRAHAGEELGSQAGPAQEARRQFLELSTDTSGRLLFIVLRKMGLQVSMFLDFDLRQFKEIYRQ